MCANKVVERVRSSALVPNIRPMDARQFGHAHDFDQLEGLAAARSWGFESPLPHHHIEPVTTGSPEHPTYGTLLARRMSREGRVRSVYATFPTARPHQSRDDAEHLRPRASRHAAGRSGEIGLPATRVNDVESGLDDDAWRRRCGSRRIRRSTVYRLASGFQFMRVAQPNADLGGHFIRTRNGRRESVPIGVDYTGQAGWWTG